MAQTRTTFSMVIAAVAAIALTSCSAPSTANGEAATGEPITVAGISTSTFFPEGPIAAQAVFDEYNAAGGLDGRPIEYEVFDDRNDPAASATAARDALAGGAVAMVGSASVIDCSNNHELWEENGIISIQATGVDPYCFTTPNISAVNSGPVFGTFAALTYGTEELGFEDICAFSVVDTTASVDAYTQVIENWSEATGGELALNDMSLVRGQASYAPNVAQISGAGCDALFINDTGPAISAFLAEATNQGISLPLVTLTSAYSDEFAASTAYAGDIHLTAEFFPYSDQSNEANAEWAALMDAKGVAKTSFAQGGYLSAKALIAILESIEGGITRDSVTEAARGMTEPLDTGGMTGTPWIFGDAEAHQPNQGGYPVHLAPGTGVWESVGPWLIGEDMGWTPTEAPA